MAKKLNSSQIKELIHIKEWCFTIMDFMISHYEGKDVFVQFSEVIKEGFNKQDLRGMRHVYKDTNEWAKGLPFAHIEELNQILNDKFGEDLKKQTDGDTIKINRIIKKGKINSEDEYRLVLNRVDEIYADDSNKEEVLKLNELLATFQK
jgi:cold shock CspA family protein